ncbi:MAG: hypothetical protein HY711_01815 [Candidatus Melainabacteria bacterium]|nr:hypothetical protein [Candidatus Melainabacteria bacterium]
MFIGITAVNGQQTISSYGETPSNYYGDSPASSYGSNYEHAYQRQSITPQQSQQPSGVRVNQWFSRYDQIRRQAQMNPAERQQADYLLSRGMAILVPGNEKVAARAILIKLVENYEQAALAMKQLPLIPETSQLHQGYYQYFNNARLLFSDYLRVQDNLFVTDTSTGKPVAAQLIQRKQMLEQLNQQVQGLDQQLRSRYGIPTYRYQPTG